MVFTLTGQITLPSGAPFVGFAQVTPLEPVRDTAGHVVRTGAESQTLDATGSFTFTNLPDNTLATGYTIAVYPTMPKAALIPPTEFAPGAPGTTVYLDAVLAAAGTSVPALLNDLDIAVAGVLGYGGATDTALSATIAKGAPVALAEAGTFLAKLKRGQSDAVLQIIGDSTGAGNTTDQLRWPYRVAQWLGQQYPAYTVNFHLWNDTNLNFDPVVTIQTGTTARVLDVWNASASGRTSQYSDQNLTAMTPVAADLCIISHGHNESVASADSWMPTLIRDYRKKYPLAGIAVTAQSPQTTASADYATQLQIRQVVAQVAQREATGFIDITSVFLSHSDWETALVSPDKVHPTLTGYQVWADEVTRRLTNSPTASVTAVTPRQNTLWVPASQFGPIQDALVATAPTYLGANGSGALPASGWSFDPASSQTVSTWVEVPTWWNTWNFYLYWAVFGGVGGGGGTALWLPSLADLPTTYPGNMGAAANLSGGVRGTAITGTDGGKVVRETWAASNGGYAKRGLHGLRITRFANNASDTLTNAAVFLGVSYERVN